MAVATLLPIEEYLSTSWDPDREYLPGRLAVRQMLSGRFSRDGGRICRDAVETSDGKFSTSLSEIFADMPSTEDQ
jgi:hypothetical protein